jgi:hypothetical protein
MRNGGLSFRILFGSTGQSHGNGAKPTIRRSQGTQQLGHGTKIAAGKTGNLNRLTAAAKKTAGAHPSSSRTHMWCPKDQLTQTHHAPPFCIPPEKRKSDSLYL